MARRCQPLLGTYVEVAIPDEYSDQHIDEAFHLAFNEVQLVEQLMSFHQPNSDLSRLNRQAYEMDVCVHPFTYEVLVMARQLFDDTDGAFDCSIAPELQKWGLLPKTYEFDMPDRGTLADLDFKVNHMISFRKPLCLDLGGIAKGYAVDKAVAVLKEFGVLRAVVNAGGDMRVLGQYDEDIYIKHPLRPHQLVYVGQLSDGAIATSAIYYSKEISSHKSQSALVLPKTKQSMLAHQSYSVIAKNCLIADGLTKALAIHQNVNAPYFEKYEAIGVIL
jgi:FAD:protein FMN transferase